MSDTLKPDFSILPPAQLKLWPELSGSAELGFVLYGGTALALRIGHRESVDFDFFSDKPLDHKRLFAEFPFLNVSTVLQSEEDSLTFLVPYGHSDQTQVKVSFFGNLDHGRVGEPSVTEDGVLQVASMDDLMATKLKVILQRIEAKDYRDVAALLRHGVSLERGLASAQTLYGLSFPPVICLKTLIYFEGGDLNGLAQDDKKTLAEAVKRVRNLPKVEIVSRHLTSITATGDDGSDSK